MSNHSVTHNQDVIGAILIALPILTSNLDEDTKKRIKIAVEKMESSVFQSMEDHPASEIFKSQISTAKFLLNIK
ncbi:MAG: hypothetical protein EKE20_15970 [Candidatus Symbiopectobacterium sp. Dall1.0]|nr:hypothetical protein [Candidatus Symbiopectobacterium sp. Dall1.0]